MKRSTERIILLAGAILLLFFAANIALNVSNMERIRAQAASVERTQAVTAALEDILSAVKDAETGQRGFVITGNASYLAPYADALKRLGTAMEQAATLTAENPDQQVALEVLRRHMHAKLDELATTIRLRQEQSFDAARALIETDQGKAEMDQIRTVVEDMISREAALLRDRQAAANSAYYRALISSVAGGVLACVIILAYVLLLRRYLTARDASARLLAEHSELLQTTLKSIGDGVITTDVKGRVSFLNTVAESLTGWTTAEARGKELTAIFNIVNESTRREVENPAFRALREGAIVGLANHTVLIARDGTEHPIDDSAAPIRLANDEIVGCVLVFRDVTERARLDTELRNADRHKDEFLATLAHELRNPLAPIANALHVMNYQGASKEAVDTSRATMERQVRQLVRLIDDLLDVSRIRLGKLALKVQRVDLARVIEQAVETVRPLVHASEHKLILHMPAGPVRLDGDPIRLAQIFSNLLSNAAKFTPPGGTLELRTTLDEDWVVVSVRDSGIGIAPDNLRQIFDIFAQVDQSLERSQGGLGIGLSLVRRLAQLHGGSVEASSEGMDRGSTFTVRLPLSPEGAPTPEPANEPSIEPSPARRRVLVVDDNRDGANSLGMMIDLMGHDTRIAYDGASALETAAQWSPQTIFLDIGLPGMNGYDVCRALRQTPWGKDATIVALTGWGQEKDKQMAAEAGFDRHVVKPIGEEDLVAALTAGAPPSTSPAAR